MKLIHYKASHANFGDDLNPEQWLRLAPGLFQGQPEIGFLGIGTIIGMPTPGIRFLHVFSSGLGYDRVDSWVTPRRVWCVRGPLTARILDLDPDLALTDGALLAPDALGIRRGNGEDGIGVMPHWESLLRPGWAEACRLAGFRLVTPSDTPTAVIQRIARCRLLITESLHGAILADALQIPWIAIATTRNFSLFKWADWAGSLQLALRVATIPSPSLAAVLDFGRPQLPGGASTCLLSPENGIKDYRQRIMHDTPADLPRSSRLWAAPRRQAFRAARQVLQGASAGPAPLPSMAGRALGLSPAHTAEALRVVAALDPQCSADAVRDRLIDRMRERLIALERFAMAQETADSV
jgi:succinoglycan biosynthesis protein ExoV